MDELATKSDSGISRPTVQSESGEINRKYVGELSMSESTGRQVSGNNECIAKSGPSNYERDENVETMETPSSDRREINITPLDSGYTVRVGCQTVAVESHETLIKNLADYLENPSRFEKIWFAKRTQNKLS